MTTNNGGPAFPARPTEHLHGGSSITSHHGMSLRDWFAGQVLAGISTHFMVSPNEARLAAESAYARADAMLAAREATE